MREAAKIASCAMLVMAASLAAPGSLQAAPVDAPLAPDAGQSALLPTSLSGKSRVAPAQGATLSENAIAAISAGIGTSHDTGSRLRGLLAPSSAPSIAPSNASPNELHAAVPASPGTGAFTLAFLVGIGALLAASLIGYGYLRSAQPGEQRFG
ncbi:MAG: hypothetical protein MRY63_13270 [Neomegalonema sp.]|nr:hypothetical protein [Neomegalonema sp.]